MATPKGTFVNSAHLKRNTPARLKREKKLNADSVRYKNQFSVTIALAPQDKPVPLTPEFEALIYEEYLTRYLEASGVTPSEAALAVVRRSIPRSSILISPVWKSQGWKSDVVRCTPIAKHYNTDKWTAAPDDILADAIKSETHAFRSRSMRAGLIEPTLATAAGAGDTTAAANGVVSRFEAAPAVVVIPNTPPQSPKQSTAAAAAATALGASIDKTTDPSAAADLLSGTNTATDEKQTALSGVANAPAPSSLLPPRVVCCIHFRAAHAFLKLRRRTQQPWWWSLLTADDAKLAKLLQPKDSDSTGSGSGSGSAASQIDDRHQRQRLNELRLPISVSLAQVEELQRLFFTHFPFDRFSKPYSSTERKSALALLTAPSTIQLVGLLCHCLYWLLFGAHAVEPLSAAETESVLLAVEKLYADVTNGTTTTTVIDSNGVKRTRRAGNWRSRPNYSLLYLPLLLDSMCSTVQNVFRMSFPKWFAASTRAHVEAQAAARASAAAAAATNKPPNDGYTPLGVFGGSPIRLGAGSAGLGPAGSGASGSGGGLSILANQAASDSLAALTDAHIVRTIDQLFDAQHYLSLADAAPASGSSGAAASQAVTASSKLPASLTASVFGTSSAAAAMSGNGQAVTQSIAYALTHPSQLSTAATVNPGEAAAAAADAEAAGSRIGSLQRHRRLDKLFHTTSHLVRSIFPKPRAFGSRDIALTGTERRYTSHVKPPAPTAAAPHAASSGGRRSGGASSLSSHAAELLDPIDEKQQTGRSGASGEFTPGGGARPPQSMGGAARPKRRSNASSRPTPPPPGSAAAPIMELSTAARQQLFNIALQNIASRRIHQASII